MNPRPPVRRRTTLLGLLALLVSLPMVPAGRRAQTAVYLSQLRPAEQVQDRRTFTRGDLRAFPSVYLDGPPPPSSGQQ